MTPLRPIRSEHSHLTEHEHAIGKRILLAEDSQINQIVAKRILESFGCEVVTANDGRRALDAARAEDFDLILMDIHMPDMDGIEATAAVRAMPRYRTIPIVALTADAMHCSREKLLELGMTDYLAKPFTKEQMRNVLERNLASHPSGMTVASDALDADCRDAQVESIIDWTAARDRMPGDAAAFQGYLVVLREECRTQLAAIHESIRESDFVRLRRAAHTLKSAADLFSAPAVFATAFELETMAFDRASDLEEVVERLVQQIDKLDRAVAEFLAGFDAAVQDKSNKRQDAGS